MNKLDVIRERHERDDQLDWGFVQLAGQQAHQDRAYLLELVSAMEDLINCSCSTCSAKNECNFWSKYEKLESEAGE
jgi:hypothetical protein